jgi:hypothetical protein
VGSERRPVEDVIEALAERYLGKHGIVSIGDGIDGGEVKIVVLVVGPLAPAFEALPSIEGGYPVVVKESGRIVPHAGRRGTTR